MSNVDKEVVQKLEEVIRNFSFGNYGLDDVDIALHDDPDSQEWVADLALELYYANTPQRFVLGLDSDDDL